VLDAFDLWPGRKPHAFRTSLTNLIDLFGASDELRSALAEQEK
jgi:hypothetical protein